MSAEAVVSAVAAPVRTEGCSLTGTVKYYNLEKGYGFISVSDGGGDVFVHQSGIVSEGFRALLKGTNVSFTYHVRNGKDTAINVKSDDGQHFPSRLDALKASQKAERDPNTLEGKVKWFDTKKAFGFIIPNVGDKDVFFHIGEVEGNIPLLEGDDVEYLVVVDEEKDRHTANKVRLTGRGGQPMTAMGAMQMGYQQQAVYAQPQLQAQQYVQAVDAYGRPVTYATAPVQAAPQVAQSAAVQALLAPGQHSGTVKWFDEAKGYGFIITAEGKDMYVNKPQLDMTGGSLKEGETVIYELQSNNGKTWAINVQYPSSAPAAAAAQLIQAQPQYAQQVVYAPQQVAYATDAGYAQVAQVGVGAKRKLAVVDQYGKAAKPRYQQAPQQLVQYAQVEGAQQYEYAQVAPAQVQVAPQEAYYQQTYEAY